MVQDDRFFQYPFGEVIEPVVISPVLKRGLPRFDPDRIVEVYRAWKHAPPDVTGTVTNALATGNIAVLEIMWQGTQSGELATPTGQMLPASGKAWKVPAVEVVNVEGGKLTEYRHYFDLMTLLPQIGAMPAPESA